MRHKSKVAEEKVSNQDMELIGSRWLDLPNYLWESIIARLNTVNRCHLALTCRELGTLTRASTPSGYGLLAPHDVPFLVSLVNNSKQFHLFEPVHNEGFIVSTGVSFPRDARILSSKEGWLLLISQEENSIFFFNPFTKARINLSSVDFLHSYSFSFSSAPTSRDCCVVAVIGVHDDQVNICVCRRGEDWSDLESYNNPLPFLMSKASPVYLGGCFYCLDEGGGLAVFDPEEESWHVLIKSSRVPIDGRFSLVELDGALLRIFTDLRRKKIQICKLDPSTNQWVRFKNLGGGSIFIGGRTSMSTRGVVGRADGNIYFQRINKGKCVHYCCRESAFHPEETFYGAEDFPRGFWIEINGSEHSTKELHW